MYLIKSMAVKCFLGYVRVIALGVINNNYKLYIFKKQVHFSDAVATVCWSITIDWIRYDAYDYTTIRIYTSNSKSTHPKSRV